MNPQPKSPTCNFEMELRERLARIETKLDHAAEVKATANTALTKAVKAESDIEDLEKRADRHDEKDTWRNRLLAGAVVSSIFAIATRFIIP